MRKLLPIALVFIVVFGRSNSPAEASPLAVCVTATTTDEKGFALPNAKKIASLTAKVAEQVAKRKAIALAQPAGCQATVKVAGYEEEETGTETALHQSPTNPYAITGTRKDVRLYIAAIVTVGEYTAPLRAEVRQQAFGQDGVAAKAMAAALEKWATENAAAIEKQLTVERKQ